MSAAIVPMEKNLKIQWGMDDHCPGVTSARIHGVSWEGTMARDGVRAPGKAGDAATGPPSCNMLGNKGSGRFV